MPPSSPKHILHVVGGLRRAGVETWLVQTLQHLPRSRVQFDFLVHSSDRYDYSRDVEAQGARVVVCPRHAGVLAYARQLSAILKKNGPYDAVHSHLHHFGGLILFLGAAAGVPVRIVHSHLDSRYDDRTASLPRRIYLRAMETLLLRYATAGCAVSRRAAAALFTERWQGDARWSILPLGIDLTPFASAVDKAEVRRQLGISPSAFVVGHVGRFEAQKNHDFLVDVAACCADRVPQAHFLLIGDGPLRPAIAAKLERLGLSSRFTFAGVRSDVPRLMMGAIDLCLFPSKYEGLGLVVLEAQAAGVRSLVSDAIPAEADVVPDYVVRKPLSAPAAAWAHELHALASGPPPGPPPQSILQAHSIEASAAALMRFYDQQFAKQAGSDARPLGAGSRTDRHGSRRAAADGLHPHAEGGVTARK